jgi:AcrR family transcriptional regulator
MSLVADKPARSLKERQRLERTQLILEAAEELLIEKGYHEASIEEIAARVGIAKGTVYLHFPSKQDLVIALIGRHLTAFRQLVDTAAAGSGSPRERLEHVLRRVHADRNSERMRAMIAMVSSADLQKEYLSQKLDFPEHIAFISERIRGILEAGKAAGEFTTTISTTVMLTAFLALLAPHRHQSPLADEGLTQEDVAAQIGQIYFTGIAATERETREKG